MSTQLTPISVPRGWKVAPAEERAGTDTLDELTALMGRLADAGDYRRDAAGAWEGRMRSAIGEVFWPVAAVFTRTSAEIGRMLPDHMGQLTDDQVVELTARLLAELDARESAQPSRPAPTVQTVEQAVALRIATRHRLSIERGELWWAPRTADPVRTADPFSEALTPPPAPGGWSRRRVRPRAASVVTVEALRDLSVRSTGLVQRHEPVPDWERVLVELRALAEPEQPKPGAWLRRRTSP